MKEVSDRFKRKMNRLFREQVGTKEIPHPEVDNLYERIRSGLVRAFLIAGHCIKKKCSRY